MMVSSASPRPGPGGREDGEGERPGAVVSRRASLEGSRFFAVVWQSRFKGARTSQGSTDNTARCRRPFLCFLRCSRTASVKKYGHCGYECSCIPCQPGLGLFPATLQQFRRKAQVRCGRWSLRPGRASPGKNCHELSRVAGVRAAACAFSIIKEASWVKVDNDAGVAGGRFDNGGRQVP